MRRVGGALLLLTLGSHATPFGAGAQDVRTADNEPVWGASVAPVEETRIGTLTGPEEYAFGRVGGVTVLPDGSVWVGDEQKHAIFVYDEDGRFVRQVGREGEGPGEFQYPSNMRVTERGTVIVWDSGLLRVTELTPDGEFVGSFNPPTHMIGGSMEELEIDRDGHLYLMALTQFEIRGETTAERLRAFAAVRERQRLFWLKLDATGAVLDSIFVERSERDGTVDGILNLTELSPLGYRVLLRNDAYRVTLELPGAEPRVIERSWEPIRYRRAERREKQRLEEVMNGRNGVPVRDIPREKPPLRELFVDTDGRLWLQRHAEGFVEPESDGERASRVEACEFFAASKAECDAGIGEWRQPVVYDVIEPEGVFLGQVALPNRLSELVHARGRELWVVERGAYGEEYVVRYRIGEGR